jgi:hypothetical protein
LKGNVMLGKVFGFGMALAIGVFTPIASAQGVFDMGSLTATLSTSHVTQSERARARQTPQRPIGALIGQRLQLVSGSTLTAQASTISTSFNASIPRRRANFAQFVEKSRKVDPAGSLKLQQLLGSTDVIAALGGDLQRYGLRTDNVADAYAIYWVQAWQAVNGDTSDPDRTTMQAVKRQSANAIVSTPEFASASDATKQEMAEAMMVQAMLISASVDTYKDDPNMMRQLGDAVRQGAKASGLDLSKMTLTDQGFVPSGKTGAADPAPGAPEQALAANAAATPPVAANDTSPPYILLAAAGGAGLGGVFLLGKLVGKRG